MNGGLKMVQDEKKILDKVIYCVGLHVASIYPLEFVGYKTGPISATSERFEIEIKGKGGHAMAPNETIDALFIGV